MCALASALPSRTWTDRVPRKDSTEHAAEPRVSQQTMRQGAHRRNQHGTQPGSPDQTAADREASPSFVHSLYLPCFFNRSVSASFILWKNLAFRARTLNLAQKRSA